MRRLAFVVMITGMFVLLSFLVFDVREIFSYDNLSDFEINQKVRLSGKVTSERMIAEGRLLGLDNNISLVCSCFGDFLGEEVFVEGVVSEYEGEKQVKVLRLEILD